MSKFLIEKSTIASFAVFFAMILCVFNASALGQKIKSGEYNSNVFDKKTASEFENDELEIFDLINRERTKRGLGELIFDEKVADIARDYSKKMSTLR